MPMAATYERGVAGLAVAPAGHHGDDAEAMAM
jgi:hypothetical protein